jgi:Tfp pilus assembly protein PilV
MPSSRSGVLFLYCSMLRYRQAMKPRKTTEKSGSTLVEVMVALLILTVLALGTAAFIYYGRSNVYAQRDRLAVLELVNGRLEALRAEPYSTVANALPEDFSTYFLNPGEGGGWDVSASRTEEDFPVNSSDREYPMTTTVRFVDVEDDANSYDALQFTVSMEYRKNSTDKIEISTYRSP